MMIVELNMRPFQAACVIILASNWVKTVVFCLLKTFIVWLII